MSVIEEGLIKIGITCGDTNGIGLEVIIKSLLDNRMHQLCTPVIYCGSKMISAHRKLLNQSDFNYTHIKSSQDIILRKINVISVWEEDHQPEMGKPTSIAGQLAFKSLEEACKDMQVGKLDAMVTAPINKQNIQGSEFKFPGHTEYLTQRFGARDSLMLLVSEQMRVAVVSGHVSVKQITTDISTEKIYKKIKLFIETLKRDFDIRKPKLAVLGLNPHAGDQGLLGAEEKEIIVPAIKRAADEGMVVYGPYAADGFFGSSQYNKFDGILAMYHDQGLIPFKAMNFGHGVNYTAGLPIIRTSPDHGTAYDLAGKNVADESSFRSAIYSAIDIYRRRKQYDEINANPLAFSKHGREH